MCKAEIHELLEWNVDIKYCYWNFMHKYPSTIYAWAMSIYLRCILCLTLLCKHTSEYCHVYKYFWFDTWKSYFVRLLLSIPHFSTMKHQIFPDDAWKFVCKFIFFRYFYRAIKTRFSECVWIREKQRKIVSYERT